MTQTSDLVAEYLTKAHAIGAEYPGDAAALHLAAAFNQAHLGNREGMERELAAARQAAVPVTTYLIIARPAA